MAINGIPAPVITSEIEPVVVQGRPAGPGATPALQSSSGLTGRRGVPPDATRRRATVPTMVSAQAAVRPDHGAPILKVKGSLADLFRMEDEQDRRMLERRGGRRFDGDADKGAVSRATEGQAEAEAWPSSPGPSASPRTLEPDSHGAAQLAGSGASGGGHGGPVLPGPRLTRSTHGRPRADSPVHAIADQWQAENPRGPRTAGSSAAASVATAPLQQRGQPSSPAEDSPSIPARRKVSFAHAEQRMFDPGDDDKALEEPVRVPFPSDTVVAARGKSAAPSSSEEAHANMAANDADKKARTEYATQLSVATGRLQSLAIKSPERVQQAIQRGILPAEVLGDRLDPQFVEDVLDLHAQFQEWQAMAQTLDRTDFGDAGGVATIIVKAREAFAERAKNQAALLAMMAETGETSSPPVPQALNADQITMVQAALNGGGQALRRMSERAERVNAAPAKTALGRLRQTLGKPKPLEAARRKDFVALVDRDMAALVTKLRIEPQHAAHLLQRAVHAGQLGADTLRPQDRALLLDVLAAKASNGGG